jgi:hypothetical protein
LFISGTTFTSHLGSRNSLKYRSILLSTFATSSRRLAYVVPPPQSVPQFLCLLFRAWQFALRTAPPLRPYSPLSVLTLGRVPLQPRRARAHVQRIPKCRRPFIETRCHFQIPSSSSSAGVRSHGILAASTACSSFVSLLRHSSAVRTHLFFSRRFLGLTAPAIPVRSGLRVFCFLGSAHNTTGSPPECSR